MAFALERDKLTLIFIIRRTGISPRFFFKENFSTDHNRITSRVC